MLESSKNILSRVHPIYKDFPLGWGIDDGRAPEEGRISGSGPSSSPDSALDGEKGQGEAGAVPQSVHSPLGLSCLPNDFSFSQVCGK